MAFFYLISKFICMPINRNITRKINIKPALIKRVIKSKDVEYTNVHVKERDMSRIVIKEDKIKRDIIAAHRNGDNAVPKMWPNDVCYIIGGGPSLKDFDWNKLKGKHVIAINKAYKVIPWAEVLYWTDARFYRWNQTDIDSLNCLKITCRNAPQLKHDVILLTSSGRDGLDKRPNFIRAGNNSGFAAINVAYHLGVKRIYLLGYDMHSEQGSTHWHEGYGIRHDHNIYARNMISNFSGIVDILRNEGVEIWNANPKSAMTYIPKCKLEDALNDSPVRISS